MRTGLTILLIISMIAGQCGSARADHPMVGFGAEIAGPAVTIPATTLPKGSGAVALRVEYVKFRPISDAELARFAAQGTDAHSVAYLLAPSLGVGYGLTDDLTVSLRLPYLLRTDIREGHQEDGEVLVEALGDSGGLGDLTFLGQYRFVNHEHGGLEWASLFGLKFPTGDTGERDRDGVLFETEHQPGSGSWDPILGLAVSRRTGPLSFDGNLLYTFATGGAQRTNLGDRLHYNAAVSYRPGNDENHHDPHETAAHQHLKWDLILEINGEWQEKQKIAGVVDQNSGGTLVYLSPGLRLIGDGSWAASLSIGVPVLENRNGVQHETVLRTVFGLSKGF